MKTKKAFKARLIGFMAVLVVVYLLLWSRFVCSGVPSALNSDTPMLTAGRAQGIKLAPGGYGVKSNFHSFQTERQFQTTISSGSVGQLLATYRREVERIIEHSGAGIHERWIDGTTDNVQDFAFGYTWGKNDGTVRVVSFPGTNGEAQVVTLCNEHRGWSGLFRF